MKERLYFSDIRYFGSNIKNELDVINLYNQKAFDSPKIFSDAPLLKEINDISEGVNSRLKTRMSTMSLGIFQSLEKVHSNLKENDEIFLFTSFAEIETTRKIIDDIITNNSKIVSPTLFHNSVHNTPLGYYTIINKIHNYCTTISDGLDTGFSLYQFMKYKAALQESCIITAGDEYSSFYELDKHLKPEIFPSFVAYRATPSEHGVLCIGEYDLPELINLLKPYSKIILPGKIASKIPAELQTGKEILYDYCLTAENPLGFATRLALPFTLNLDHTAVVNYVKGKYLLCDVRL